MNIRKIIREEIDDLDWIRDVKLDPQLTPAQIFNRYGILPSLDIMGPYIAKEFNDIKYVDGKLILSVDEWGDFVGLFTDNNGSDGWINAYLAKKVLSNDDYWEPYDYRDLIGDWTDDVWSLVIGDDELFDYIVDYIKKEDLLGRELESGHTLDDDMLIDKEIIGDLINGDELFNDLRRELSWAYASSYNISCTDNIYRSAVDSIKELLNSDGTWSTTDGKLEFDVSKICLELITESISNCWDYCKRGYDHERHNLEDLSYDESVEDFCDECIEAPFDSFTYFINFMEFTLHESDSTLQPRYNTYHNDKDLNNYFKEDIYSRI